MSKKPEAYPWEAFKKRERPSDPFLNHPDYYLKAVVTMTDIGVYEEDAIVISCLHIGCEYAAFVWLVRRQKFATMGWVAHGQTTEAEDAV